MGDEFSEGDTVRMIDSHHAMNSDLKKHEGDTGVIKAEPSRHNDKYLVHFGTRKTKKVIDRWWINSKWLEKDDGDSK